MTEVFGERLKRLRIARKMSQQALAQRIGVSEPNLSKWENGYYQPLAGKVPALARVLAVSTDYLLTGRDADDALRSAILRGTSPQILLAMARREL